MDAIVNSVHYVSLLIYIIAFIATGLFWNNLRHEKHWVGFPITLFFFSLHEFFEILHEDIAGFDKIFGISTELFAELSEIIGAIILTYSLYYLIKELRTINYIESQESTDQE